MVTITKAVARAGFLVVIAGTTIAGLGQGGCTPAPQGTAELGISEVSAGGLCCWRSSGDPRAPILRFDLLAATCAATERRVALALCATTCCLTPGGSQFFTLEGSCVARGGWARQCPAGSTSCCQADIWCCSAGDSYDFMPADACVPPRMKQDNLLCDRVCCAQKDGAGWTSAGSCAQDGVWVDPQQCAVTTDGAADASEITDN